MVAKNNDYAKYDSVWFRLWTNSKLHWPLTPGNQATIQIGKKIEKEHCVYHAGVVYPHQLVVVSDQFVCDFNSKSLRKK